MTEKHTFGVEPITCHSFSLDRKNLAISKNDNNVIVYKKEGTKWTETGCLTEHGQRVTSIDWAPKSNRLVTCGADRNAYVWTFQDGSWKPLLVILRINRAATYVKWSPEENKFAVGSGARLVSICYFEEENNWWVSKHIKKPIRSTVTCLDWHPNNILLAAGSTDFKARVFSAYVKEIESKPSATNWGSKMPFGNMMAEFSSGGGGWVHSVSFSASGDKLAWVGHDSSIAVVNAADGQAMNVVKGKYLPFYDIVWVTENSMVAVGFDCCPKLFTQKPDGSLEYVHDLDIPNDAEAGKMSAMNRFKNLDKRGGAGTETATALKTQHQNTITLGFGLPPWEAVGMNKVSEAKLHCLCHSMCKGVTRAYFGPDLSEPGRSTIHYEDDHKGYSPPAFKRQVSIYAGSKANTEKVATSAVDGQLIIWDLKGLEKSLAGLKIA